MKRLAVGAALFAAVVAITWSAWPSTYYGSVNDQRTFGMINGSRAERDKPEVIWGQTLAKCAHEQAVRMRDQRRAFHGTPCDGYTVDQLVGMGPSPFAVYEAFLSRGAPEHRATIFNARLRTVGTGVAHDSENYYLVLNFAEHR